MATIAIFGGTGYAAGVEQQKHRRQRFSVAY